MRIEAVYRRAGTPKGARRTRSPYLLLGFVTVADGARLRFDCHLDENEKELAGMDKEDLARRSP